MTDYWTISHGYACRNGYSCRECKRAIYKNEPVIVRDGRKIRLFYHVDCFSGDADPRTQPGSSFYGQFNHVIQNSAPVDKGRGKWSVNSYGYNPSFLPAPGSTEAAQKVMFSSSPMLRSSKSVPHKKSSKINASSLSSSDCLK